jgi:hypothetical protein
VFRENDMTTMRDIFRGLLNTNGIFYINIYSVIFLALAALINIYSYKKNNGNAPRIALNLDTFKGKLVLVLWIFLIVMFAYVGDSAFIYAQF